MKDQIYENPVIRGFHPDPSICRAGDGYVLVTSSFEFFPGVPVFTSKDLVNWKQVAFALSWENPLDLSWAPPSGGVWAPTIRFDETRKRFYCTIAVESKGNCIVSAERPEGPWSAPVWVKIGGIDPSMLFLDGHCLYCTNDWAEGRPSVVLGEVDPDTGETLRPFKPISHGCGGGWLEAPHIVRVGEWYILLAAEGGTYTGHMEIAARAKDPYGPYENCPHNPILTNRNDTTKQVTCSGHADLVEDFEGNFWFVHLGMRRGLLDLSQLGRETYLTPVRFMDGWPVVENNRARIKEHGPLSALQRPGFLFEDDFTGERWPVPWQFVRNPDLSRYRRGEGRLLIDGAEKPSSSGTEGTMVLPQPDFTFTLTAEVVLPKGDLKAGLLVMNSHLSYCFFAVSETEIFLERRVDDLDVVTERKAVSDVLCGGETVRLIVTGSKEWYSFGFVQNGRTIELARASARFLNNSILERSFCGTMVGLHAEGHGCAEVLSVRVEA